jgi:hypothetical protein
LIRRSAVKKLRSSGRVFTNGRKTKPQTLELTLKDIEISSSSASENVLVDLSVADESGPKRLALV